MNDRTAQLIERLSAQLGTTAERLWSILLYQARLSFFTDLIFYAITAHVIYVAYRFSVYSRGRARLSLYEDEWLTLATISCVAAALLILWAAVSLGETITKLLNPDYWALERILLALR